MSDGLREKTVSGLKWTGIEKVVQQIFVFCAGVLLARRLFDDDYGLVAVLSIFTYMANALQDSGFPSALIRKKNVTQADYSTVFFFNIGVGLLLYLALFFSAPLIGRYYDNEALIPLARFVFLSFVFNAMTGVQAVQLIKEINYKKNAKINLLAVATSYAVALTLAYTDFGPWAIASQMVVYSAMRMLMLWIANTWRPSFVFSKNSFNELFSFGSKLMLKSIVDTTVTRITPTLIGKYFGFSAAGNYDQGNRLYTSGIDLLSGTMHNVSYPVLSKIEAEGRFKHVLRKLFRLLSFLTYPFFMLMILVSAPFVLGVLGQKWEEAIPVIQLLAGGGIFYSLNGLNIQVLKVKGKSSYLFYFEIVRLVLLITAIATTIILKESYLWIVFGLAIINAITFILNSLTVRNLIGYKLVEQIRDTIPYFLLALVSVAGAYLIPLVLDLNHIVLLVVQSSVVLIIYCLLTYLSGSIIVKEIVSLIKDKKLL